MSIIYQAHKKGSSKDTFARPVIRSFPWFDVALWLLVFILLIYTSVVYFPKVKKYFSTPFFATKIAPPITLKLINEADYQNKHKVTGVFLADNDKIALINHHYYHLGDNLDGMQIVQIDLNDVTVRNEHQKFILSQQTMGL